MPSNARAEHHPEIGNELVREWMPTGDPRSAVVITHGMGEHSGRYEDFGEFLAERGHVVRSFDLIGAGGSGGHRWDIDEWSRFHDQIERHTTEMRQHEVPLVLIGFSLGGNLALGYVLDGRPQPDLLVLSAPGLDGGAAWLRAAAPVMAKIAPKFSFPNPWAGEHLSRDPAVGERYYSDPLVHTKSTLRFGAKFLAAMDWCNQRIDDLDIPTLVIHGGQDRLVPTGSSERLGALDCVDRKVYEGLRHEVLNEPEGPEVMADIASWIDEKLDR